MIFPNGRGCFGYGLKLAMNRTLIHIHLKKMGADQSARLLSGRDFVASTVGYAPLSSMCDVSRSGAAAHCPMAGH